MKILPAIDLIDGQCVRLKQGDYARQSTYKLTPLDMAALYERLGYDFLHIVDLDGAKEGLVQNKKTIQAILKKTKMKMQVGGGIRSLAQIEDWLSSGVQRVLVGTLALEQPELVKFAIEKWGSDRVVVCVDTRDGVIYSRGWKEQSPLSMEPFVEQMLACGVTQLFCTDIERDGMKKGPNTALYERLVKKFPFVSWTAAGGIRTTQDLKKLESAGVAQAVMGSLFYEGSFLTKRIIPCLDIRDGRTVKGTRFENLKDAGDPVELAKRYMEEGADELVFLDITASKDARKPKPKWIAAVAKALFIPFTVGGGISSMNEISEVLQAGADKVSLNSAIVRNPELINEAAERFGTQCIVAAIDAKKTSEGWKVAIKGGSELTDLDVLEWVQEVERRGAGEILLTSMDYDGTKAGFDLELLKSVAQKTSLPVIASGGAGKTEDFVKLFQEEVADAALAASVFHFKEISIVELKSKLASNSITIRL